MKITSCFVYLLLVNFQVRFEVHKDCLPLPEKAFQNAIKDNYDRKTRKFKSELNFDQVSPFAYIIHLYTHTHIMVIAIHLLGKETYTLIQACSSIAFKSTAGSRAKANHGFFITFTNRTRV